MILLFFNGGSAPVVVAGTGYYILFRKNKMLIQPDAFRGLQTPNPTELLTGNEYLEI